MEAAGLQHSLRTFFIWEDCLSTEMQYLSPVDSFFDAIPLTASQEVLDTSSQRLTFGRVHDPSSAALLALGGLVLLPRRQRSERG